MDLEFSVINAQPTYVLWDDATTSGDSQLDNCELYDGWFYMNQHYLDAIPDYFSRNTASDYWRQYVTEGLTTGLSRTDCGTAPTCDDFCSDLADDTTFSDADWVFFVYNISPSPVSTIVAGSPTVYTRKGTIEYGIKFPR